MERIESYVMKSQSKWYDNNQINKMKKIEINLK